MNSINCKTFTATATIGLIRGYKQTAISTTEFKEALLKAQQKIVTEYKISLSTKVSSCEILFLGQDEPSMEVEFIQYPKFIQEEYILKKAIIKLIEMMMYDLEQNRVVVIFTDETIMLEQTEDIDPRIQL
jgi:hypothetical protein